MTDKNLQSKGTPESPTNRPVNWGRHVSQCSVCAHPDRQDIERDFVQWKSPIAIAQDYGRTDRKTIYLHAHAFGLFRKRDQNIRAALTRIIEKARDVEATAAAVVAAVQAYAKINSQGQWIERSEHLTLNDLFERMTEDELDAYARDAKLPDWFAQTVGATPFDGRGAATDK
jgi:hypothetical protein